MKLPRFSLRTLLVLIALISLPLGWIGYQFNWIRQRHEFLTHYDLNSKYLHSGFGPINPLKAPWPLGLFGEPATRVVYVQSERLVEAKSLFPETAIVQTDFKEP